MYSGIWYLQKFIPQLIWMLYPKNKNEEVKEIFILNFSHILKNGAFYYYQYFNVKLMIINYILES